MWATPARSSLLAAYHHSVRGDVRRIWQRFSWLAPASLPRATRRTGNVDPVSTAFGAKRRMWATPTRCSAPPAMSTFAGRADRWGWTPRSAPTNAKILRALVRVWGLYLSGWQSGSWWVCWRRVQAIVYGVVTKRRRPNWASAVWTWIGSFLFVAFLLISFFL